MRSFSAVASGVCAFVLACLLIEQLLPEELPPEVREKVTYLAAHGNEYDALFLGSSRVAGHVIPTLFDRTAADEGLSIKSFNAGVAGMFPPQDSYVLERILEKKPARLRWVFVELQPLAIDLPPTNRDSLELLYWHDWPRFCLLCRRLAGTKKRRHWRDRVEDAFHLLPDLAGHAQLFAKRFTNLGRAAQPLQRWILDEPAPAVNLAPLDESRGWVAARPRGNMDEKQRAALEEELAQRRKVPPVRDDQDPATQAAFDRMVASIRRAGATPILLVPPNAGRSSYFYPTPQRAQHLTILDFCNPQKYPELYKLKNRLDPAHLNPAGAEIFTRELARQFAAAIAAERPNGAEQPSPAQNSR
jgi:hypothetical protein